MRRGSPPSIRDGALGPRSGQLDRLGQASEMIMPVSSAVYGWLHPRNPSNCRVSSSEWWRFSGFSNARALTEHRGTLAILRTTVPSLVSRDG
jgi:hypothetical protein